MRKKLKTHHSSFSCSYHYVHGFIHDVTTYLGSSIRYCVLCSRVVLTATMFKATVERRTRKKLFLHWKCSSFELLLLHVDDKIRKKIYIGSGTTSRMEKNENWFSFSFSSQQRTRTTWEENTKNVLKIFFYYFHFDSSFRCRTFLFFRTQNSQMIKLWENSIVVFTHFLPFSSNKLNATSIFTLENRYERKNSIEQCSWISDKDLLTIHR